MSKNQKCLSVSGKKMGLRMSKRSGFMTGKVVVCRFGAGNMEVRRECHLVAGLSRLLS